VSNPLFGDLFGDFFGTGSVAPESVARKVLAIGDTLPLDRTGIQAAFRLRVRLLRPHLTDDAADGLRLRDVAGETEWSAAQEITFASRSKEEQLAELLWAREDLLRRVPKPVTDAGSGQVGTFSIRNWAAPRPLVTASDCRSRAIAGTRNARVLGQVEAALERYRRTAAEHPESWVAKEWAKQSEDEHFTELAVNARLICGRCATLLASPVYLHRSTGDGFFADADRYYVNGDNLRGRCSNCWQAEKDREYFWGYEGEQRECACGTEIVCCSSDRYLSTRWWWADRARSCSPLCAREKRNADARRRRLAARENRRCVACDAVFTPGRSDARYCSSSCRQDAYRKRKLGVVV
jgi:hypothetical protein